MKYGFVDIVYFSVNDWLVNRGKRVVLTVVVYRVGVVWDVFLKMF